MSKLVESVVINKPVEQVFTYLTDYGNLTEWELNMLEAEQTSEGKMGVGTTARGLVKAMGMKMEWTSEVTEFEQNKRLDDTINSGGSVIYEKVTFESDGETTEIFMEAEYKMGWPMKLLTPLMVPTLRKQLRTNLANLKKILEAAG
jgi:uncharacterized membrane protein